MSIEIQRIPPTRFPVCVDCGHEIDDHEPGCTNRLRGYRMTLDEAERKFGSTALSELGNLNSKRE